MVRNSSYALTLLASISASCCVGHPRSDPHRHLHVQHDVHDHHHREHGIADGAASDFASHGRPDVFDSCLIACYGDIVDRYGREFADNLRSDGFVFETCPDEHDDDEHDDDTNATLGGEYATDSRRRRRDRQRVLGATNQSNRLWTGSRSDDDGRLRIPYRIKSTSAFDQETLDTIASALRDIEDASKVIQFIERTDEVEHIYFSYETYYANICASNLGKQTNTTTKIYLGWCREPKHRGNIIHEIMHALGFWHEHSRPDRDDYINVHWDNVLQGAERNLEKAEMINSLGSGYDYLSIMHYPWNAYAINSTIPTLVNTKLMNKWETIGQRVKLSDRDINQLRLLYQCKSGPRDGSSINVDNLCSEDCPCWEQALGKCESDHDCMGELVCGDTPSALPVQEYLDQLPLYPHTSGIIQCDEYCHSLCCRFPDNIVACPETCDTAPPNYIPEVIPKKMCIQPDDVTTTTTVATSATGATRGTTTTTTITTTTTTTTTTTVPSKWYVDWSISKCVKDCVGPAPCGGLGQYVAFHDSVEICCSAHLYWMSFSNCHTIPDEPTSASPTSLRPSKQPITLQPITPSPSSKPATSAPSNPPVMTTNKPSNYPTSKPSGKPTTNNALFYIDWNVSKCVQDCIGPAPCGGLKPTWISGYPSVEICCSNMSWKPFNECSNVPQAPLPTKMPTDKPTAKPTTLSPSKRPVSAKPTTLQPSKYPVTENPSFRPTAKPSSSPTSLSPSKEPVSASPTTLQPSKHPVTEAPALMPTTKPSNSPTSLSPSKQPVSASPTTLSPSVKPVTLSPVTHSPSLRASSNAPSKHPVTDTPTTKPSKRPIPFPSSKPSTNSNRWYPGTSKCLNDGNEPSWQHNLYTSAQQCCSNHFSWDLNNCLGVQQQPTYKWYANWSMGKCVQDCENGSGGSCGGLVPGSYVITHSSAEACCSAHMSYLPLSQCKY